MEPFAKIAQRTTERMYEDERLRSNLSDDEAKVVLGWAENWLQAKITSANDGAHAMQIAQNELTRIKQAVNTMNTLAAKPGKLNLVDAVAAFQPQVSIQQALPREQAFKLLTEFVSAMWRVQEESVQAIDTPSSNQSGFDKPV